MPELMPNFFHYLMQAFPSGYQQGINRRSELEEAERWNNQFDLQREAQELQQRQINAMLVPLEQRNQILQTPDIPGMTGIGGHTGMPDVELPGGGPKIFGFSGRAAQPGRAPRTALDDVSDEKRQVLGFPTRGAMAQAGEQQDLIDLRSAHRSGAALSKPELQSIGAPTEEAQQLERITTLEKPLQDIAKRYVAGVMTTTRGRLAPQQLAQLASQGYDAFKTDRQMKMLNLTPDEEPYARTFFARAVMDAYAEQLDRDLQTELARARTEPKPAPGIGLDDLRQLAQQLQNTISAELQGNLGTAYQMYEHGFPQGSQMTDPKKPNYIPPNMALSVQAFTRKRQVLARLQQGMAQFAAGRISPEQVQALYEDAATQLAPLASGTAPHGAGSQPIAGGQAKSQKLIAWEAYARDFGEAAAKADLGPRPPR